jgi:hypothetical protein
MIEKYMDNLPTRKPDLELIPMVRTFARLQESSLRTSCATCKYRESTILIDSGHLPEFLNQIGWIVLHDAQGIDPEVFDLEKPCDLNCIADTLAQSVDTNSMPM